MTPLPIDPCAAGPIPGVPARTGSADEAPADAFGDLLNAESSAGDDTSSEETSTLLPAEDTATVATAPILPLPLAPLENAPLAPQPELLGTWMIAATPEAPTHELPVAEEGAGEESVDAASADPVASQSSNVFSAEPGERQPTRNIRSNRPSFERNAVSSVAQEARATRSDAPVSEAKPETTFTVREPRVLAPTDLPATTPDAETNSADAVIDLPKRGMREVQHQQPVAPTAPNGVPMFERPAMSAAMAASTPVQLRSPADVATATAAAPSFPNVLQAATPAAAAPQQNADGFALPADADEIANADIPTIELTPKEVENLVASRDRGRAESAPATIATRSASAVVPPDSTLPPAGAVKIAASYQRFHDSAQASDPAAKKDSLTSNGEEVTNTAELLGITAAKPVATMSTFAAHALLPVAETERMVVTANTSTFDSLVREDTSARDADLVQVARRSVDSAVAVAEHYATGEKRAVTLQFSVSGVDLGVRVELRSTGVHTTFRTDSPELRAALAQEWQSMNVAQTADRAQRMVEPVFTSSSATSTDAGNAGDRGGQAREGQRTFEEFSAAHPGARVRSSISTTTPTLAPRAVVTSAPGRLHAFA